MSKLRALIDIYRNKLESKNKTERKLKKSPIKRSPNKHLSTSTYINPQILKARTSQHLKNRKLPNFNYHATLPTMPQTKLQEIFKRGKSFEENNKRRYKSNPNSSAALQMNLPNLKFKKIDPDAEYGVDELFPVSKKRTSFSVSLKSKNVNINQLKQLIKSSFKQKQRVICVVYKCLRIFKHAFISCDIALQNFQHNQAMQSFKQFQQKLYTQFCLNKTRSFYLFDVQGTSITKLTQISSKCYIIVLSIHPFFQDFTASQFNKIIHLKNSIIAAHWDSGILLQQFIQKTTHKRLLRHDFLKNYIEAPASPLKKSLTENKLQRVGNIYQNFQKEQQLEGEVNISNNIGKDLFFRSSPKRKDFQKQDVKLIRDLSLQFIKRPIKNTSRPSVQYPLSHRDLLRNKYQVHDFILETKFNRQELLQLKSIYDSLITLSIRNHSSKSQLMRLGLDRITFIEGIKMFGFQTSSSLLKDLLKNEEYIGWKQYLGVMEILIHKQSDGALDEYIHSLRFNNQFKDIRSLSYDQLLKIVRYGLQRLLLYFLINKGYQHIITKNIFNHLQIDLKSSIEIQQLKKLAGDSKFKHIFLS